METRKFPRIRTVRAYTDKGKGHTSGGDHFDIPLEDQHWMNGYPKPIAHPMSRYDIYSKTPISFGINALGSIVVEVEADDGTTGVGVSTGGEPACFIVENHLSRFVEGQDPRNVEIIWDQMFNATLSYGRKGLALHAISAVDNALWDVVGKIRNEPVYYLLGGKCKERLPVYSTTPRPDKAKEFGFYGAKISCPYSPAAGEDGFQKNVEHFKEWRRKVGPDYPLMLDCWMSLNVNYTVRLVNELSKYGLKWMEDYLPADDYPGYNQVRAALRNSSVLLTTGEHEYSRYGFRQLIESGCVDIIQPDPVWMGGITEARRIVAMASAHDMMVIPHTSSVYTYHLQYAFPNCPIAEFLDVSHKGDKIVPYFGKLFLDEPLPKNGFIDLPDRPGFGVTLCKDNLRRPYERSEEHSKQQAVMNANPTIPAKAIFPF